MVVSNRGWRAIISISFSLLVHRFCFSRFALLLAIYPTTSDLLEKYAGPTTNMTRKALTQGGKNIEPAIEREAATNMLVRYSDTQAVWKLTDLCIDTFSLGRTGSTSRGTVFRLDERLCFGSGHLLWPLPKYSHPSFHNHRHYWGHHAVIKGVFQRTCSGDEDER